MAEVLSQQEIDQLLNNIQESGNESTISPGIKEAIPFDFRLPNRISKNQLRTIRSINESFAETFSSYLMSKLQTIININVISVDQIYYSEYVLSVSNPACLFTIEIKDTDIKGILEFSSEFALTLVDRLLGGYGKGSKQSKVITPIEQKVLYDVVERILQDLKKAWHTVGNYEFHALGFESDIDFAQITSQSESVLLVTFEIFIGEKSYLMNLCLATYAFDSVLSKLTSKKLSTIRPINYSGTTARNILITHLEKTDINLRIEFGKAGISFNDLMELKKGDIIIMDKKVGEEVDIEIEGKLMFNGIVGTSNNHKAIKITRRIETEE